MGVHNGCLQQRTLNQPDNPMEMLQQLVASGRIVDIMIAFVILETFALGLIGRAVGRRLLTRALLLNTGAGVSLMLALKVALSGTWWGWIVACVIAALCFHLFELAARWYQTS